MKLTGTVVDNLNRNHLALVMKVNGFTALAVATVFLHGSDHRVVVGGGTAASGVIKLVATVPGGFTPLGNPVTLLDIMSVASCALDMTSLELEAALSERREAGFVGVNGSCRDGSCS